MNLSKVDSKNILNRFLIKANLFSLLRYIGKYQHPQLHCKDHCSTMVYQPVTLLPKITKQLYPFTHNYKTSLRAKKRIKFVTQNSPKFSGQNISSFFARPTNKCVSDHKPSDRRHFCKTKYSSSAKILADKHVQLLQIESVRRRRRPI